MITKDLFRQLLLLLILGLTLVLGYGFWERHIRADEAEQVIARMNKAWGIKLDSAERKAQATLTALGAKHATQISAVTAQRDAALRGLQNRPGRATAQACAPTDPAGPPAACTGAGLAREDAEFLTREAAAGAEQQVDLLRAIGAYESCRRTLEEVTDGTDRKSRSPEGILP